MAASANPERHELEWQVLQIVCAFFGDTRAELSELAELNETHFLDPVHRAIFQEITQSKRRGISREELRRRLPEAMTRLGWPDLDFDALFVLSRADRGIEAAAEIVQRLRNLSANEGGTR